MKKKPEGKAEKMFTDIGRRIDELIRDLQGAKNQAKVDYADRIEEIKRNAETLKKEFTNFKETHKDRWEEAESNLERAGEELKKAFDALFTKRAKEKDKER